MVRAFYYAVRAGIIARNADMIDVVFAAEVFQGLHPWFPVIGDDFADRVPPAEDILIDEFPECLRALRGQGARLGPGRGRAARVREELVRARHVRRIDVDAKHGRGRVRDRRGYEDLRSLADLAQVTGLHVPADVGAHVWPPEPLRDEGSGREEPAVPDAIV